MPRVSFVIPTYLRPSAVARTLDALGQLEYPVELWDVVVIDNVGDKATERVVETKAERGWRVGYEVYDKPGAAAARNHGAGIARGELLVFCDDDILIEPGHLKLQLETRERYGDCLVNGDWKFSPDVVRALRSYPFGRYRLALEDRFRATAPTAAALGEGYWELEALSACNLAISRQLFWKLGGFDEEFPFAGAEDREFSARARACGVRLIRNDRIALLHNDQTITFDHFCIREERSAQTMAVLAAKQPHSVQARAFSAVNGPLSRDDSTQLAVTKVAKRVLAVPPVLTLTHWIVHTAEQLRLPDGLLSRVYSAVVGVHIFRGFRQGLGPGNG